MGPVRNTMLTVLVVTYNSEAHVTGLLRTLQAELEDDLTTEVIVVDNASTDSTVARIRASSPALRLVESATNLGYAAALNVGLAHARLSGAVLVLNPDVVLRGDTVQRLHDAVRRPGVGVVVPRLVDEDGSTSPSLRRDPSVRRAWSESVLGGTLAARLGLGEVVSDPSRYEHAHPVDWATGAVMMISEECRAELGNWDESFFLYSEEVEFCQRARRAGFRVQYEPLAVATHVGGAYRSDPQLWVLVVRNRVSLYRRGRGRGLSALFLAGVLAGELVRAPASPAARAAVAALLDRDAEDLGTATGPSRSRVAAREPGFVWFAAQDWWYHNRAHSDFQLMRSVAADRPVLLVNSIGLRVPRRGVSTDPLRRIGRKLRSTAKTVRRPVAELPNFYVMTPVILPLYGGGLGSRLSAWSTRQQVRAVARAVGLGRRPHIGVTIPTAWDVVAPMARRSLVYNRADLHSSFPEADGRWVASLEARLLQAADAVLYVSRALMSADEPVVGRRGVFLDHGVDSAHFTPQGDIAPELADIPHPRIGFFGGLDDYVVDMELLRAVATDLPECHLVLVGDATCDMVPLTSLPNVHWFGHQPYERIPDFGRGFDVGLMPWLDNEWITNANPIKLKEYLSLGLPVVSTDFPEVRFYADVVDVAPTRAGFVALVRSVLARPPGQGEATRRASVVGSTWDARARTLLATAAAGSDG